MKNHTFCLQSMNNACVNHITNNFNETFSVQDNVHIVQCYQIIYDILTSYIYTCIWFEKYIQIIMTYTQTNTQSQIHPLYIILICISTNYRIQIYQQFQNNLFIGFSVTQSLSGSDGNFQLLLLEEYRNIHIYGQNHPHTASQLGDLPI